MYIYVTIGELCSVQIILRHEVTPGSGLLDTPALVIHPPLSGVRLQLRSEDCSGELGTSSGQTENITQIHGEHFYEVSFHFIFFIFCGSTMMGHYISLHQKYMNCKHMNNE